MSHDSMKRFGLLLVALLTVWGCTRPRDLSGHWDIVMDPDFKGNRSVEQCVIHQENLTLTVRFGAGAGAAAVSNGEMSGDKVRWGVHTSGANGFTASWIGDVDRSGTGIKGTWQLTLADGFQKRGDFIANRQSR